MRTFTVATILSASAALVGAQVTYNGTSGTFVCSPGGGAYCAGDSLSTNIIIRCTGTVGQPGNCNDNLAGIPPVGVKSFAPCYQSSSTAGDAACSFNGTVYPDNGTPFPVPVSPASPSGGTSLPSPTGVTPIYPTGGNGTGVAGPTGTGGSSTNPTGPGVPIYTGAAVANKAGGALAVFGLAAAALL